MTPEFLAALFALPVPEAAAILALLTAANPSVITSPEAVAFIKKNRNVVMRLDKGRDDEWRAALRALGDNVRIVYGKTKNALAEIIKEQEAKPTV